MRHIKFDNGRQVPVLRAQYNHRTGSCRCKCPSRKDGSPLCKRAHCFQRGILCRKNALERRDEAPKVSIPRTPQAELFEPARPKTEQMRLPEKQPDFWNRMSSSEYRSAQQTEKPRYSYPQQSAPAPHENIVSVASPDKNLKRQIQSRRPFSIFSMHRGRRKRRLLSLSRKCALNPNR